MIRQNILKLTKKTPYRTRKQKKRIPSHKTNKSRKISLPSTIIQKYNKQQKHWNVGLRTHPINSDSEQIQSQKANKTCPECPNIYISLWMSLGYTHPSS